MEINVEKQLIDLHPKISRFLIISGIVLCILFLLYSLIFGFNPGVAALSMLGISNILLGLKYQIAPKYMSFKSLDRVTGIILLIGAAVLGYDLFFNIFPKFK